MLDFKKTLQSLNSKEDKIIFQKIIDKIILSEKTDKPCFSDFLPYYKINEFLSLFAKQIPTNYLIFGGYEDSERVLIAFYKEYLEIDFNHFPIDIIEISYNLKYSRTLSHRDFLGAIIGLGIDRDKIGDIIVEDAKVLCFIKSSISSYVKDNLNKVGSTKVLIKNIEDFNNLNLQVNLKESIITVSSLRLDNVLSTSFNISRSKTTDLIKKQKVFLNWSLELNTSKNLKEGDIITIRGIGRIKFQEIIRSTKKERLVLKILRYI